MLNEKALEVATGCYSEGGCSGLDERERREVVADIVAAYLSALLPEDAADLVAEMTSEDFRHEMQHLRSSSEIDMLFQRAASLIQSQAARVAELEAGLLSAEDGTAANCLANYRRIRRSVQDARTLLTKDRQP